MQQRRRAAVRCLHQKPRNVIALVLMRKKTRSYVSSKMNHLLTYVVIRDLNNSSLLLRLNAYFCALLPDFIVITGFAHFRDTHSLLPGTRLLPRCFIIIKFCVEELCICKEKSHTRRLFVPFS